MNDLISRQAAIDALSMMQGIVAENGVRKGISLAWQQIKDLPSAQPEVICCKDCKHRPTLDEDGEPDFPTFRCPCQCEDFYYSWMPKDDWFCANAERRGK